MNRLLPRLLLTPAMATLFLWMIVPLVMTIYFSLIRYNLMQPDQTGFAGLENFEYFVTDPSFGAAVVNTILLLGSVILITVFFGVAIALIACHFGLRVKPNTESLSRNTTGAVVSAITAVILLDAALAVLTRGIGLPLR
jgi:ABC-type sugar transport system permease subunit